MWGRAPPPFYDDEATPVTPTEYNGLVSDCMDQLQLWRFGSSWDKHKQIKSLLVCARLDPTSSFFNFPALELILSYGMQGCVEEYDGWEEYQHNSPGVKLFEKPIEGYSLPMWRIEGTLPATIDECVAILNNSDFEKRKKIDRFLKALEILEKPSEDISVEYLEYSGIFPVSGRDAVYFKALKKFSDGTKILFGQTVNRKDKPQTSAAAKAGMFFVPTDSPFTTRIIGFALVDPMGNIPKWLINKGKAIAPSVVGLLGKMMKDKYGHPKDRMEELQRQRQLPQVPAEPAAQQRALQQLPHRPQQQQAHLLDKEGFLLSLVEAQSRLVKLLERTRRLEKGGEEKGERKNYRRNKNGGTLRRFLAFLASFVKFSPSSSPLVSTNQAWFQKLASFGSFFGNVYNRITQK